MSHSSSGRRLRRRATTALRNPPPEEEELQAPDRGGVIQDILRGQLDVLRKRRRRGVLGGFSASGSQEEDPETLSTTLFGL